MNNARNNCASPNGSVSIDMVGNNKVIYRHLAFGYLGEVLDVLEIEEGRMIR